MEERVKLVEMFSPCGGQRVRKDTSKRVGYIKPQPKWKALEVVLQKQITATNTSLSMGIGYLQSWISSKIIYFS